MATITAIFVPIDGLVHDTVSLPDTIIYNHTLYFIDTVSIYHHYTLSVYDTSMVYDTISIYDTVRVNIDEIYTNSWNVFAEGEYIILLSAKSFLIGIKKLG